MLGILWLLHLFLPAWLEPAVPAVAASKQDYRSAIMEIGSGGAELLQTDNLEPLFSLLDQPAARFQQDQCQQTSRQDRTDSILEAGRHLSFVFLFYVLSSAMLQQTINGIELGVWLLVILALFQEYQPLSVATRVSGESHLAQLICCNLLPTTGSYPRTLTHIFRLVMKSFRCWL